MCPTLWCGPYSLSMHVLTINTGPTLFAPIISEAHRRATAQPCTQQNQKYHILLIITDGVINDMQETIEVSHDNVFSLCLIC